jgi:paraquat-inducible protein B
MAASPVIKERRSISIIWLIPLVALVIGGWLIYKAVTEKGPTITISFESAAGLEAGKTKIKYKDVEVGVVQSIVIGEDLSKIVLKVLMQKGSEPYLTAKTQFWVVRARVDAGSISGLDTLLGGAYIGIEPSNKGKSVKDFIGLEVPPVVTSEMKGKRFALSAERLGSLNPGSPIYFRQIQVGQVVDYKLDEEGHTIGVNIFVKSPYDQFVRENTRFWNASGLDLDLTANGLKVNTESFVALMVGGIAFNTFSSEAPMPEAKENSHFKLYATKDEASDDRFKSKDDFYVEFKESVRGLSVGAPLEFRGFRVGSVVDIEMKTDFEELEFSTMVRVSLERKRMSFHVDSGETEYERFFRMINKGFRAQLKTGNLLTGQLFVNLEFHEDLPPVISMPLYNDLPLMPSLPSPSQEIVQDAAKFMKKLNQLPLEEIGKNLQRTMAGVNKLVNSPELQTAFSSVDQILKELKTTTRTLNSDTVPQVNRALAEMDNLIKDLGRWVDADSPLYEDVRTTLQELAGAARSINDLADMLERHPEALIQGKTREDR